MSLESLQQDKLELEIEGQRRALHESRFSEWRRPSAVIPAITALVSVIGLITQGILGSYAATKSEISRATTELKLNNAQLLEQKVSYDMVRAAGILDSARAERTESQKALAQAELRVRNALDVLHEIANRNGSAKEAMEAIQQKPQ